MHFKTFFSVLPNCTELKMGSTKFCYAGCRLCCASKMSPYSQYVECHYVERRYAELRGAASSGPMSGNIKGRIWIVLFCYRKTL